MPWLVVPVSSSASAISRASRSTSGATRCPTVLMDPTKRVALVGAHCTRLSSPSLYLLFPYPYNKAKDAANMMGSPCITFRRRGDIAPALLFQESFENIVISCTWPGRG